MSTQTTLIKNATLWPSAYEEVIEHGSLLIKGGRIEKVGRFKAWADLEIDAEGGLVMPGFIQTHVHCCQTLFRGLAEDMALLEWLKKKIWPFEAGHTEETIRLSAQLTCAELIRGGTTAFLSFETVRHTGAVMEAVKEAGLTATICHCLMDETCGYGPLVVDTYEALGYCDMLLDQWGDDEQVHLGLAPRFALSCSEKNLRLAADYARDRGILLHTHASEQIEETELIRAQTGMGNIAYLHSLGLSGPDVYLAHCVHPDESEKFLLAETGTHVLHCPSANMKLGSGIAPVPEYLDMDISVSLGADGAPCNNRLDMFTEMRLAGLLQKMKCGPATLGVRDIVYMATQGGADALGAGDEMGSLEVGKRASLIIVSMDNPHCLPSNDVASDLVYACLPSDVNMTMVNGKILYMDGEFRTLDMGRLK